MNKLLTILLVLAFTLSSPFPGFERGKAPSFTAKAVKGTEFVDINYPEDFKDKYMVLIFYPFDFTYVCPTELIAFSDKYAEFQNLNTEVLGISADSQFTHLAWIQTPKKQGGVGELNYPLVSDFSKNIGRAYKVLEEDSNDDLYGAALRGLFIIDGEQNIRHLQINDAPVGRNVEEVLRLIQAFQHTDEHGVVCPANWEKGSMTMDPTEAGKNEYFHSLYN